ncbi:MAG: alpha/beta fold hydrolase [Alphaproteobacteria bacterium]
MTDLVLIPGLLCNRELWAHQIAHLAHLATVSVADVTQDDSIAAMAIRLLDKAPARFALAGLSMGGYVAQEVVRQAPDRVVRLALFDTSARPDTDDQRDRRRGLIDLSRRGQFKGVTPRLLPLLIHPDRLDDTLLVGRIAAMAEDVGQAGFVRQQTAIMGRIDGRPLLPHIACPTLVVGGEDDLITPPEVVREIADLIPGAACHLLPHCGHLATMEEPERVTGLMESWLSAG